MKSLGKIEDVTWGRGGYQDVMFGVSFSLSSKDGSCQDFWGTWVSSQGPNRPEPGMLMSEKRLAWENAKSACVAEFWQRLEDLMEKAKVDRLEKLKGIPIEITWNQQRLHSWRILTEVL